MGLINLNRLIDLMSFFIKGESMKRVIMCFFSKDGSNVICHNKTKKERIKTVTKIIKDYLTYSKDKNYVIRIDELDESSLDYEMARKYLN